MALQSPYPPSHSSRPSVSNIPPIQAPGSAPAGTFASGTKVQVGNHRVIIDRYLSEGGFAHVYLVRLPKPVDGVDVAVLKRVAVPDKEALANMRTEVETMKKLIGHRHIVKYFDSHASQLKGGGFEVFLLMEYCNGGGLIDFMNTRLQNRLTEPEIVKIISDVAQGVACMHYLKPPLLHRDLKVENVLITTMAGTKQFKLCDFGSTAPPRPAATNAAEGRLIEDDVQRHTTMQYRSPEMIDVYRRQPIDEKSDVWALGVLLYKLCYYTTPFEERGQMAILNASFKFPGYPSFSDKLKKLIAMMLQENPKSRPNIYQVVKEICGMRGIEVPIKDIYAARTASEVRRNQELPQPPSTISSPLPGVGAYKAPVIEEKQLIPEITPMRRGRPTHLATDQPSARPSPSPGRRIGTDPFAALDGSKAGTTDPDEISKRFPSLDQFSLLHEAGSKFAFEPVVPSQATQAKQTTQPMQSPQPAQGLPTQQLSQRVTEALADDAFLQPTKTVSSIPNKKQQTAAVPAQASQPLPKVDTTSHKPVAGLIQAMNAGTQTDPMSPPKIIPEKPPTSSIGTMTSPKLTSFEKSLNRPLYRFPSSEHQRSLSQPRTPATAPLPRDSERDLPSRPRPILTEQRSSTQTPTFNTLPPQTARPSLETINPAPVTEESLSRTKSEATRHRPLSAQFDASRFSHVRSSSTGRDKLASQLNEQALDDDVAGNISSNVEFLKKMEEDEPSRDKKKRQSSGSKYAKLSLSGTKNLFAGRFGDAFKRFEGGQPGEEEEQQQDASLTPIAGSVANDDDHVDVLEETEEMSPEVRRELERRRLSQEERRVAEAAAAYKARVSENGTTRGRDNTRASLIQNKVQSLLEESSKSPTKTAEGYGRFTNSATPDGLNSMSQSNELPPNQAQGKPVFPPQKTAPTPKYPSVVSATLPRPAPPAKPQVLRTGGSISSQMASPNIVSKPSHLTAKSKFADSTAQQSSALSPEDWEVQFSKRYPSLSGLEMVETEISSDGRVIRDV